MALTRFFDDDCRIQKYLEESVNVGNYYINVPGNGPKPYFIDDPNLRMQKWGGNLSHNQLDLENDLRGQTRSLNKDNIYLNNYVNFLNNTNLFTKTDYPIYDKEITGQSRVIYPAWTLRELNYLNTKNVPNNFNYLHLNPQENICIPFHNNISTRIIEKDYFSLNN